MIPQPCQYATANLPYILSVLAICIILIFIDRIRHPYQRTNLSAVAGFFVGIVIWVVRRIGQALKG
ncbi:hypothetical protein ACFSUS_02085 [Spirosoma soli]|uniref:Uncharacterized protein n=1 Tax=Spirosoma soli TaxID=1770529 RepID=A0ABW5LX80_9BACT